VITLEGEVLIDLLMNPCRIWLPQAVADEATQNQQHPDAQVVTQRVASGSLVVESPTMPTPDFLDVYHLGQGEKEAIGLYLSNCDETDYLVTDDKLAYLVCSRMEISVRLLPDLIIELVRQGRWPKIQARKILEVTRPRYSAGIMVHLRVLLEEVIQDAQA